MASRWDGQRPCQAERGHGARLCGSHGIGPYHLVTREPPPRAVPGRRRRSRSATKITEEQIYPKLRDYYLNNPKFAQVSEDELYHKYATQYATSAGTVAGGVGLDLRLHPAVAIRIASLEYRHAFLHPIQGREYSDGFSISTGIVMRMGTW